MTTLKRRTARAPARGAAMVEGIVVIVVMFVFFGMNMWAYKAYGGKLDQANSTRRDALYHASHNCQEQYGGDTDTYADPSLRTGGSTGPGGDSVPAVGGDPRVSAAAGQAGTPSIRSGGITTSDRSGQVNGSAVVWTGGIGRTSMTTPVRTQSSVWCNQERHDGFLGTFTGAWGAAKGIADLFR